MNLTPEQQELLWWLIFNQARSTYTLLNGSTHQLQLLKQDVGTAHALGPLIDPTAYRDLMWNPNLWEGQRENEQLLDATIEYVQKIDAIQKARAARIEKRVVDRLTGEAT